MTFARLRAVDLLAMLAALALLFVMALDWYSTKEGQDLRLQERRLDRVQQGGNSDLPQVRQETRAAAEDQERNAWQEDRFVDRLILMVLLLTVILAVAAGCLRAAGRRFEPPWTPSAFAALAAATGALLVAYRIAQAPGDDRFAVIEIGPPLAVVVLVALGFCAASALRNEEAGRAFRELPPPQAREHPAG